MKITAEITGLKYSPKLGRRLKQFRISSLEQALASHSSFLLEVEEGKSLAVSWWTSPKPAGSYPYAGVYDTLWFAGKRVTIIPVFIDEGEGGDLDFLQWDTVSLMSLLGVYVIIGYYRNAEKSKESKNKITEQKFDLDYLSRQLVDLLSYHSSALHWNLSQTERIGELAKTAFALYRGISKKVKVRMHPLSIVEKGVSGLVGERQLFVSRKRAKEGPPGEKPEVVIKDSLGSVYRFTADEARGTKDSVLVIEGRHTDNPGLPSTEEIKDGLLKMILYTNLQNTKLDSRKVSLKPTLLLTTGRASLQKLASDENLKLLKSEASTNGFDIWLNGIMVR